MNYCTGTIGVSASSCVLKVKCKRMPSMVLGQTKNKTKEKEYNYEET